MKKLKVGDRVAVYGGLSDQRRLYSKGWIAEVTSVSLYPEIEVEFKNCKKLTRPWPTHAYLHAKQCRKLKSKYKKAYVRFFKDGSCIGYPTLEKAQREGELLGTRICQEIYLMKGKKKV